MAGKSTGYGRSWKKWLAIYAAVGGVLYLIVYLLFFATDSGGGGMYCSRDRRRGPQPPRPAPSPYRPTRIVAIAADSAHGQVQFMLADQPG